MPGHTRPNCISNSWRLFRVLASSTSHLKISPLNNFSVELVDLILYGVGCRFLMWTWEFLVWCYFFFFISIFVKCDDRVIFLLCFVLWNYYVSGVFFWLILCKILINKLGNNRLFFPYNKVRQRKAYNLEVSKIFRSSYSVQIWRDYVYGGTLRRFYCTRAIK